MSAHFEVELEFFFLRASLLLISFWVAYSFLGYHPRARVTLCRIVSITLLVLPFLEVLPLPTLLSLSAPRRAIAEKIEPSEHQAQNLTEARTNNDFLPTSSTSFISLVAESAGHVVKRSTLATQQVLITIWAAGACLLLARWSIALFLTHRLAASSEAPPEWACEAKTRLCAHLGLRTRVRLGIVEQVCSPLLIGPFPFILLPRHLLTGEVPEDIYSALAHELVHIRERDWYWSQWIRLVSALIWPLPLVWFLRRVHDAASELVCDHVAAISVGGPEPYAGSLARQSLYAIGHFRLATLPMLSKSDIRRRIGLLLSGCRLPAFPPRAIAVATIVAVTITGILGGIHLARAESPSSGDLTPYITIQADVKTADGQPLPPENWKASLRESDTKFFASEQTENHFIFRGIDSNSEAELFVTAFGYHTWTSGKVKAYSLRQLSQIVLNPAPKTTIKGILVDENGKPIPGMTLRLVLTNLGLEYPQDPSKKVATNDQGQFEFKDAGIGGPFIIQLRFPNSGQLSYIEGPHKDRIADFFGTWTPNGGILDVGTVKGLSSQELASLPTEKPFPRIDPSAVEAPPTATQKPPSLPEAGIGAVMHRSTEGQICVYSVFPGAPAEQSGIHPGDIILSVDGKPVDKSTSTQDFRAVMELIRGPAGSSVHLTIGRLGGISPLAFDIVRASLKRGSGSAKGLDQAATASAIEQLPKPDLHDAKAVLSYIQTVSELANQQKGSPDFSPDSAPIVAFTHLGPENIGELIEAQNYFDSFYIREAVKRMANESNEALIIAHLGNQPHLMEIVLAHDWVVAAKQQIIDHLGEQTDPMDAYGWMEAAMELRDPRTYGGLKRAFPFTAHCYEIYLQLHTLPGFDVDGAVSAAWNHAKQVQDTTPSPLITPAVEIATAAAERGHLDALDYLVRIIATHRDIKSAVECPVPEITLTKITDAKGSSDEILAWYHANQSRLAWDSSKDRYQLSQR